MEKISISYPFVIFTSVLLALDTQGWILLAWIAIVTHELGHLLCLKLMRCDVESIRIGLAGLSIEYGTLGQISYLKDAVIAFAGPSANLLSIIPLTIVARKNPSESVYFLIGASVIIAVFNLLPAMPCDGGRILLALTSARLGAERGVALAQLSTAVTGTAMAVAGLWVLLKTRGNFMLFATSIVILSGVFGKRLYRDA